MGIGPPLFLVQVVKNMTDGNFWILHDVTSDTPRDLIPFLRFSSKFRKKINSNCPRISYIPIYLDHSTKQYCLCKNDNMHHYIM